MITSFNTKVSYAIGQITEGEFKGKRFAVRYVGNDMNGFAWVSYFIATEGSDETIKNIEYGPLYDWMLKLNINPFTCRFIY